MLSGKHYIAGEWIDGPDVFQADNPSTGNKLPTKFQHGTEEIVDQAVVRSPGLCRRICIDAAGQAC